MIDSNCVGIFIVNTPSNHELHEITVSSPISSTFLPIAVSVVVTIETDQDPVA